jgi:hypothetical protein
MRFVFCIEAAPYRRRRRVTAGWVVGWVVVGRQNDGRGPVM